MDRHVPPNARLLAGITLKRCGLYAGCQLAISWSSIAPCSLLAQKVFREALRFNGAKENGRDQARITTTAPFSLGPFRQSTRVASDAQGCTLLTQH